MFEYLQTIIYSIIIPVMLYTLLGGISATKRYILKINRMNSILYRFKKTGKYKLLLLTLTLIMKTLYNQIIYSINNNIVKKSDKLYEIIYYIKGHKYVLCIDFDKKPEDDILQILDQDLNDCTDEIVPYFTPYFDFNNKLTPKYFNKDKLIFTLSNDLEFTFKSNELIDLSKKSHFHNEIFNLGVNHIQYETNNNRIILVSKLSLDNDKKEIIKDLLKTYYFTSSDKVYSDYEILFKEEFFSESFTIPLDNDLRMREILTETTNSELGIDDTKYEEIFSMGVSTILNTDEIVSKTELTNEQKDKIKYILSIDNLKFTVYPEPVVLEQQ